MNKKVIAILVSVISFIAGYQFYPMLNEINQEKSSLSEIEPSMSENQQKPTSGISKNVSEVTTQPASNSVSSLDKKIKSGVDDAEKNDLEKEVQVTEKSHSESDGEETEIVDEESLIEVRKLESWLIEHREHVKDIIDNNVAAEVSERYEESVFADNPFYSQNSVRQNSNTDDKWATEMEQELRYLIQQHEFAQDVEVIGLTCKQLMCEIMIKEISKGSWFPIYASLFQSLASKGIKLNSTDTRSQFMMRNGDEYYAYGQLFFF